MQDDAARYDSYRCSNCGLHILIPSGVQPGKCECQNATTFLPDPIPETLGERVKWKRNALHISLDELGRRVGATKSHLSAIEHRKTLPGINLAVRLAKTFDVSLDWLVGDMQ